MAERKGDELVAEADKKQKSASSWFGSKTSKMEEATELYDKAAAQYKLSKSWQEAGDAYVKAAELCEKTKNDTEGCNYYINAAKAYKNISAKDSLKYYKIAVDLHTANNRFSTAAKLYKEIAELEEKEMNVVGAMKAWNDAADCYFAEDSTTSGNQCLLQVASLSATDGDYKRAASLFEKVAQSSLEGSKLVQYSVKDYLYKAALCRFVLCAKSGDCKDVESAIEKYKDMFPAFDGSRECKFLEDAVKAFSDDDIEAFTGHVFKFDQVLKLDNWQASMLLEIKTALKKGPQGGDDDDDYVR
jgi:alpha-soluble NSF attachment protein